MLVISNKMEFIKNVEKSDGVICVGAGKRIQKVPELFGERLLIEKIKYVIDNDINKQNTFLNICGKKLPIISVSAAINTGIDKNVIFLITCVNYNELLAQLQSIPEFAKKNIYCLTHILAIDKENNAMLKKIPDNIRLYDKPIIPKVIHYCWFGKNPIPDNYKKWMESWHKFCPDYEIKQWDETNYDITKNRYMLEAYEEKKWGFVPDYARLDIIYNHGGIYLDTDVELVQNLDDLLYQDGFAGFENDLYVALGLGFGARKGLPIIKKMMDTYDTLSFLNEDGSQKLVASPVFQTKLLLEHGLVQNGEYQIIDDFTIYPEKMLSGKSAGTRRVRLTDYTRSIHHYDGSWLDDEVRCANAIFESHMNQRQ